MKNCPGCARDLPLSDFGVRNRARGWLKPRCKACTRAEVSAWQKANRTAKNAYKAAWRARDPDYNKKEYAKRREYDADRHSKKRAANADAMNAKARADYHANKTARRAYLTRWAAANPERMKAYRKAAYEANKPRAFEDSRRRRARKLGATVQKITVEQIDQRMSVFGYRCSYCGGAFEHVEHAIPLARGGLHCLSNLRPSCQSCNSRKHTKTIREWLATKPT